MISLRCSGARTHISTAAAFTPNNGNVSAHQQLLPSFPLEQVFLDSHLKWKQNTKTQKPKKPTKTWSKIPLTKQRKCLVTRNVLPPVPAVIAEQ